MLQERQEQVNSAEREKKTSYISEKIVIFFGCFFFAKYTSCCHTETTLCFKK